MPEKVCTATAEGRTACPAPPIDSSPGGPGARSALSDGVRIPCLKLTRPDTHSDKMWLIYRLKGIPIEDEFDGAEIGERITLEYCEMTKEEIDALPEFEGW